MRKMSQSAEAVNQPFQLQGEKYTKSVPYSLSLSLYSSLSIIAETVVRCSVLHAPTTQCSWHPVLSQYASVTVVIRYYYREHQNNYIISLCVCVWHTFCWNYYNYTMTMCVMNNYRQSIGISSSYTWVLLPQFWYDLNVFVCNCNLTTMTALTQPWQTDHTESTAMRNI